MSDINLDFVVSNNSINFTVQPNDITITPSDVQLTVGLNSIPIAGGANQQVQYNKDGVLTGNSGLIYTEETQQLSTTKILTTDITATGNVYLGNTILSNVYIVANTLISSYSDIGDVSNVRIDGGINGYVLQTDGTGNLSWTAQTGGGGGNGVPGGSNTQIQYNDAGLFGGNVGFTFNEVTGDVDIPGNLIVVGNISGNVQTAYLANYATVANSVAAGNIVGTIATAVNVTGNNQSNITSVGTLTNLTVAGTTTIQQAKEKVTTIGTGASGTIDFDLLTSAIQLETANATANFTLNFRGNSTTALDSVMSSNESMTCTFINQNGASSYVPTAINIDSATPTIVWAGAGGPGAGTINGKDAYTFNIIKTASATFTVFASRVGYV